MILIVSIPDICVLPYFLYSHEYRLTRKTVFCAILSDQIVVGCPIRCAYFILFTWMFEVLTGLMLVQNLFGEELGLKQSSEPGICVDKAQIDT